MMPPSVLQFSEAAIFSRLIEAEQDNLSPELAQHILSLHLSDADERRIVELLPKAESCTLTPGEQDELESLNHIADLVSLWHSKARRTLQQHTAS